MNSKDSMFEITRTLTASTSHVTEKDIKQLCQEYPLAPGGWLVLNYKEGCIISLFNAEGNEEDTFQPYSYSYRKLVALARELKCDNLRLDRDGPVYEGYETYEW